MALGSAWWGRATPFENHLDERLGAALEIILGDAALTGNASDLIGEVGVMLGAAPDQEDQVHGVNRVHLAGIAPGLQHCCATAKPIAIVFVEMRGKAFAAADDLHGEDLRGLWLFAGKSHLGADVISQRNGRIILDGEVIESAVPEFEDMPHHFDVEAELVGEVVMQVGLGQTCSKGYRVHAGALVAVVGELFRRG